MEVFNDLKQWKARRGAFTGSLGLVPTMGFLHEGHLSLVRRAREENDAVVAWIFVNPAQFAPEEDFETYPRDMDKDLGLLRELKTEFVLAPSVEDIYPPGFQTYINVEDLSRPLEGGTRPDHFRGVATVVAKMIGLTRPHRAYFGQKDGQQCAVVKTMVRDLSIPTEIVVCPTVREEDGLALSSRNVRLKPDQRRAAPVLHRALQAAEELIRAGEEDADAVRRRMREVLAREPLAEVDYVSVARAGSLEECSGAIATPVLLSLAVRFGAVRLIDNIPVTPPRGHARS